jgi:hypothetical protein
VIEQRAQRTRPGERCPVVRHQHRERDRRRARHRCLTLALQHGQQRQHRTGAPAHRLHHALDERVPVLRRMFGHEPVVDAAQHARRLRVATHAEVERELERHRGQFRRADRGERGRVAEGHDQRLQVVGGQLGPARS